MSGPGFGHWPSGVIMARRVTRGEQHTLTRGRSRRHSRRRSLSVRVSETVEVVFRRMRGGIQVRGTYGLMVRCGMVLGKIIGTVSSALAPVDLELALTHAIANPVKTHVDGFRPLLLDRIGSNATGSVVIGCDGRRWLWMAQFGKSDAKRAGLFAVVEQGSEFGFGCTRQDFAHYVAQDVHGTVGFEGIGWRGAMIGQRRRSRQRENDLW